MHPKELLIKNFSYALPDERIAKYPLAERDQSKLLVYAQGEMSTYSYLHLHEHIPANSLLIFNNTKVVEARLLFKKASGAAIEIFCLEPHEQYPDITSAMLQKGKVWWKCLVGGAKKWKETLLHKTLDYQGGVIELSAERISQQSDHAIIEFNWSDSSVSFAEILHLAGLIPLPPYLNRKAEDLDIARYQTIYAQFNGSVAAPTAGLHFTDEVFAQLSNKNIQRQFVTLHVGAGTFKPVKSESIEGHEMHAEFMEVSLALIDALLLQIPHPIIAVGTTSMRTIESLYWIGIKTILNPDIAPADLTIHQWDPYDLAFPVTTATESLTALKSWMLQNKLPQLLTKTQIIIAPGYVYRICQALITNFHQPQSTLLLLVSALIGEQWKKMYQYALDNDYRFLSYGDGCLIWNEAKV